MLLVWKMLSPPERPLLQSAAFASRVLTRAGRVYDKPDLLRDASRIVNYWYHNRPVLIPFFESGMPYFGCGDLVTANWGYGLGAFFALTLAWEGWHLRRKDVCTVELVHQDNL